MSRNQFRGILITAAIVIVLADAASAFAMPVPPEPSPAGVAAQQARGGFRRIGPEADGVIGRDIGARRALGYLAGAEALAVAASPAPDDDSCWFYTDQSQSVGYWGDCPQ